MRIAALLLALVAFSTSVLAQTTCTNCTVYTNQTVVETGASGAALGISGYFLVGFAALVLVGVMGASVFRQSKKDRTWWDVLYDSLLKVVWVGACLTYYLFGSVLHSWSVKFSLSSESQINTVFTVMGGLVFVLMAYFVISIAVDVLHFYLNKRRLEEIGDFR